MKLRKGQERLEVRDPCIGLLDRVCVQREDGYRFPLAQVTMEDIIKWRKTKQKGPSEGVPCYVAVAATSELHFWPKPDRALQVEVLYYPPMVVR